MERSHFLAKLIGPVCIAAGLGMLFNGAIYRAMFERALHDYMLIYLSGVIALTIGLAIVILHNEWKWRWPLLITVFGWLALIGGVVRIIAPQAVETLGLTVLSHPDFFIIDGVIAVLLGVLLSYFGYLDPLQVINGRMSTRRGPVSTRRK
jgi:hypothetical protein